MVAFSMGKDTLAVPMKLFLKNRLRLCASLASSCSKEKTFIFLQGGSDRFRGETSDAELVFRQESNFHWCFGVQEPDFFGAINVETSRSILFIPRLDPKYAIWTGVIHSTQHFKEKYEVVEVYYSDEIVKTLKIYGCEKLLLLHGLNTDSGRYIKPASFEGISEFETDESLLFHHLSELRVFKTPEELEVIRYANKISSEAHREVMRSMRPNRFEYQYESLFQHHVYAKGGARHVCYTCIGASGTKCAVLHYGHAGEPNSRLIKDGDMCLFDMGAEYYAYCSDITCSFPANGKFTQDQAKIYNAVLDASRAVLRALKPGVSWTEMHMLAERIILSALKNMELVLGDVEEMLQNRIGGLFMPHGLGHFLGVDVHDAHGYPPEGPPRPQGRGVSSLRTARTMQPGMVITVEPGCYFIASVLHKAFLDDNDSKYLNRDKIIHFMDFGGVRIEDNVVITDTGCELLTDVPRTVEEVEAEMVKEGSLSLFFD